jgi:hypothetical protein
MMLAQRGYLQAEFFVRWVDCRCQSNLQTDRKARRGVGFRPSAPSDQLRRIRTAQSIAALFTQPKSLAEQWNSPERPSRAIAPPNPKVFVARLRSELEASKNLALLAGS